MLLVVVIAILAYAYYWYIYNKRNKYLDTIPGPPNIAFLGSSAVFCNTTEILGKLQEYYRIYGSVFKVRLGPIRYFIVFADAKSVELVLSSAKHTEKSEEYDLFHPWLGTGLLTSNGAKWRRRRKMITPAFHFSILAQFVEVFDRASNKLVEKLSAAAESGSSVDVAPYVGLCSLDIICEAAMDVSINAQENADMAYVRSVKRMGQIIIERTFHPLKMADFTYQFTKTCSEEREALKILHDFTRTVIRKRKDELNEYAAKFNENKKQPFLNLLLQMSDENSDYSLSEDDIQEEVDTFMFEGHDTTTAAISFALYLLTTDAAVQQKAHDELEYIFRGRPKSVTFQDLQRMSYLELVIKETMRLYPSVPFFTRALREEVEFEGRKLPKDCCVVIAPYILHRDPTVFPDPEKFDPERFRNFTSKSAYAYVPFSAGPRNCIGQKFAMLMVKTVLAKLLLAYEVIPAARDHKPVAAAEVVIKPANGVVIRLTKRELN